VSLRDHHIIQSEREACARMAEEAADHVEELDISELSAADWLRGLAIRIRERGK
jgi:hypothetical protein